MRRRGKSVIQKEKDDIRGNLRIGFRLQVKCLSGHKANNSRKGAVFDLFRSKTT